MSATTLQRSELDFFVCKRFENKQATFYVRDGIAFMYVGSEKVILDDGTQDPDEEQDPEYQTLNLKKDIKLTGFLYFYQREQYYGLAFIEHKRKHSPIGIKFGNGLEE